MTNNLEHRKSVLERARGRAVLLALMVGLLSSTVLVAAAGRTGAGAEQTGARDEAIVKRFGEVSRQKRTRIVVFVPDRLPDGFDPEAMTSVATADDLLVLIPDPPPDIDEDELKYRRAMADLLSVWRSLPKEGKDAAARGEWIDMGRLAPEARERVRAVLALSAGGEPTPAQWAEEWEGAGRPRNLVLRPRFDPYLESEPGPGTSSEGRAKVVKRSYLLTQELPTRGLTVDKGSGAGTLSLRDGAGTPIR